MSELRFGHAINMALEDAMREDDRVFLIGEDIGKPGGPFGVTRELLAKFGPERVLDTPLSEATIAGAAVGAAMSGLKPVLEIMFIDFMTLALDAMVNQAAKARYMFGGQYSVPMVVRTPHGGGIGAGPQHSQCLEAWMAHVPGLKVVCPSTAADAYGLMRTAIDDPNPVIFVENKALYARKSGSPQDRQRIPIGRADTVVAGSDVTLVTYGFTRMASLEAAAEAAKEGVSVEVIDLRSLQPWDEAAVAESLARTHRLIVCHEAVEAFGIGAEIVARMSDVAFDELDAPPLRVGAPFMPPPFSPSLESRFVPDKCRILDAVRRVTS